MGTITFDYRKPALDGADLPSRGYLEFSLLHRETVDGTYRTTQPFNVGLVDGAATVVLSDTSADQCWQVREGGGIAGAKIRYVAVAGDAAYTDLPDVDRTTLLPTTEGQASWDLAVELVTALTTTAGESAGTAAENALTATTAATEATGAATAATGSANAAVTAAGDAGVAATNAGTAASAAEDARVAAVAAVAGVPSEAQLSSTFARVWAVGDEYVDTGLDASAHLNALHEAASAAGGGTVWLKPGVIKHSAIIRPRSNVILAGGGGRAILEATTDIDGIVNDTSLENYSIEGVTFSGHAIMPVPEMPKRARAVTSPGYQVPIDIRGSLAAAATGWETAPVVRNITVRNCTFLNSKELPVRLFGIGGSAKFLDNTIENCKDAGFGYNESLIVSGNSSYMSSDNGFSISRGNQNVVCSGNTVKKAAYSGIWMSGWIGYDGPRNFTVTGNVVDICGWKGIDLIDAPKFGTITGNTVYGGYQRGASDHVEDYKCVGIGVSGTPSTDTAAPTSHAEGLVITGNVIRGFARAGISYTGAKELLIESNMILDCGSEFASSGGAILPDSTLQNMGIIGSVLTECRNVVIRSNMIIDTRATPFMNRGIYPPTDPALTTSGNVVKGARYEAAQDGITAALAGMSVQRRAAGRWYAAPSTPGDSLAIPAGTLFLVPFMVPEIGSIARAAARVTVGAVGATLRFGIYTASATSAAPNVLVSETAAVAVDAAGTYEAGLSGTYPPGLYWMGVVAQGGSVTIDATPLTAAAAWHAEMRSGSTASDVLFTRTTGYSVVGVTGALPASALTLVGRSGITPRIAWRWA